MLANVHATVPSQTWHVLLARALRVTEDPSFGVTMGKHSSLSMLQMVGQLILGAPSLRHALGVLERYQDTLSSGLQFRLDERDAVARLHVESSPGAPAALPVELDFVLSFLVRAGSLFARASDLSGTIVSMKQGAPSYAADFQRSVRCAVAFRQEHDAISFPRALLDRERSDVHGAQREVIERAAQLLLSEGKSDSVTQSVRRVLIRRSDVATVDTREVARLLRMNTRKLRRRLADEGTRFSSLLDEARLHIARSRLLVPEVTIKEVAGELGFSEPSAFHRAFKRWTGETPSDYVKQHSSPSPRRYASPRPTELGPPLALSR